MVKADPKHDYYADLEVPMGADAAEIKKQFKKLALKYHPDRNPGKEVEFNAKFQAIQSAHEILLDPAQRTKYDADRRKAAAFGSYTSPTATNMPGRSPYTNFPPPPQRPPPTSARTTYPMSPSSGANRYAGFTTSDPNAWNRSNGEAQAKADAAKAFAGMKPGQNATGGSFGKSNRHARANSFQQNPINTEPPKGAIPRPRSGWDQAQEKPGAFPGMARSNTMRVPKKAGFATSTPGGDEPPARSTASYVPNARGGAERPGSRNQTQYPPPPQRRPEPLKAEPPRSEPFRPDLAKSAPPRYDSRQPQNPKPFMSPHDPEDPFANTDRKSTPYATAGGERTYFSSEGLHRSASSHSNNANGWPSGYTPSGTPLSTPGTGRHRSASPNIRSPNPPDSRSYSSSSSYSSDDDVPTHVRRASADHRPADSQAKDNLRRPGYPTVTVEDEKDLRPKQRSTWNSQTTSPVHTIPKDYSASQPGSRRGSGGSEQEDFFQHRVNLSERGHQLPKSPLHATAPWNYQNFEKPLEKSRSWHEKYGSKEDGNNQRKFEQPPAGRSDNAPPMYDSSDHNSPVTPKFHNNLYQTSPKTPTQESRSPSWPYWAIPSSVTPKKQVPAQESSSFHSHQQSSFTSWQWEANVRLVNSFQFPSDRSSSNSPLKSASAENINTNFSPQNWHGKFNGDSDDYLGATTNGSVPRGRTSPIKGRPNVQAPFRDRPKGAMPGSGTQANASAQMPPPPPPPPAPPIPPASPTPAKFSKEQWQRTFEEPNWAYPPPPPVQSPRLGSSKRPKPPRKMSTANKRPTVPKPANVAPATDAEDEGDASNEASNGANQINGDSPMDIDPALTPPKAALDHTPMRARTKTYVDPMVNIIRSAIPPITAAPLDDPTTSRLNLSDLKNSSPIAPSQSGIRDLNDLRTTLPFHSTASPIPNQSSAPRALDLPNPPKAPPPPEIVNPSTWEPYIAYIRAYMAEWSLFNTKMLAHFNTRQEEVENQLGNDWMSSIGEEGYAKYMRGLEEDFRVRAHWDVSWERHRVCMRGLGKTREKAVQAKCHC